MPDTPEASAQQTLLSFDYGRRRIGIAVGQAVTGSASPLAVASNGKNGPDWRLIGRCIDEWRPDRLLVGLPLLADGTRGDVADEAQHFAAELGRFAIPVECVDERYTSREATERLKRQRAAGRRRVRKEHVDAAAAVLIAERWLRGERLTD